MDLLKKLLLALSLSAAILSVSPVMAKPAGKIENQTPAETRQNIQGALEQAEANLVALKEDADFKSVMAEFKKTKQIAKTNESATTYSLRSKALGRLGKARLAYKKGKKEEALAKMEESVEYFKKIKTTYDAFMK